MTRKQSVKEWQLWQQRFRVGMWSSLAALWVALVLDSWKMGIAACALTAVTQVGQILSCIQAHRGLRSEALDDVR